MEAGGFGHAVCVREPFILRDARLATLCVRQCFTGFVYVRTQCIIQG